MIHKHKAKVCLFSPQFYASLSIQVCDQEESKNNVFYKYVSKEFSKECCRYVRVHLFHLITGFVMMIARINKDMMISGVCTFDLSEDPKVLAVEFSYFCSIFFSFIWSFCGQGKILSVQKQKAKGIFFFLFIDL